MGPGYGFVTSSALGEIDVRFGARDPPIFSIIVYGHVQHRHTQFLYI